MARRRMTAKQLRYFGTKRQRSALKSSRARKTNRVVSIPRRRYSRIKRYARRVGRAFSPSKAVIGGAGYAFLEPFAVNMFPALNSPLLKGGMGYVLAKKSGVVGDIGKAALYIEIYKLSQGFAGGIMTGGAQGSGYVN